MLEFDLKTKEFIYTENGKVYNFENDEEESDDFTDSDNDDKEEEKDVVAE